MTIAKTIANQIGNPALFMLGAKNLIDHGDALSFRVRGSKAVNYIKITLTPADLYTMEFGKVWGSKYTVKNVEDGMYFDMLRDAIERNTGLYTSL